jgi:hypothetical protein
MASFQRLVSDPSGAEFIVPLSGTVSRQVGVKKEAEMMQRDHGQGDKMGNAVKRGAAVVVSLFALGAMLVGGSSAASAATTGTATSRGFNCGVDRWLGNGRQVQAYSPQMTSTGGDFEQVWWSPELWTSNGSSWVRYPDPKPWYQASAGLDGLKSLWFSPSGTQMYSFLFNNLPAGTYALVDHYYWSNGTSANAWSPYTQGGYACTYP